MAYHDFKTQGSQLPHSFAVLVYSACSKGALDMVPKSLPLIQDQTDLQSYVFQPLATCILPCHHISLQMPRYIMKSAIIHECKQSNKCCLISLGRRSPTFWLPGIVTLRCCSLTFQAGAGSKRENDYLTRGGEAIITLYRSEKHSPGRKGGSLMSDSSVEPLQATPLSRQAADSLDRVWCCRPRPDKASRVPNWLESTDRSPFTPVTVIESGREGRFAESLQGMP